MTTGDPRVGLLWLPALGVAARHYIPLALALQSRGIALETVEWRGTGTSPLRPGRTDDWGYRELLTDAAAVYTAAQRAHPGRSWLFGGHSMGGQLAALLAASAGSGEFAETAPPQGLVLIATGVPHWRLYRGRMRGGVRTFAMLLPALTAAFGHFPGKILRFAGREARGVMGDWRHSALTGRYAAQGIAIDFEAALRRLEIPVIAVALDRDALAPLDSLRALTAKMPDAPLSEHLMGETQLGVRADHFAWLKRPEAIAEAIASGWRST